MTALTVADRDRLVKILGLLSSTFPGERDAAAQASVRFLRERGLTWSDVIGTPQAAAAQVWSAKATANAREAEAWREGLHEAMREAKRRQRRENAWRDTVVRCLERWGSLKPWELQFLRALLLLPSRRLPPKHRRTLNEVADRLGVARAAA